MHDKMSAELKTINANGLIFAYLEAGKGPLVLCLHGFPDTPHTFSDIMPALAEVGYQVVAPFMRGYPPTTRPSNGDYAPLRLGEDVLALITGFGRSQAIVIGHDWGALAGYAAANIAPERITKLVTLAVPHPRVVKPTISQLRRARHFVFFQIRSLTRWWLQRRNFSGVNIIYKRWSPNWDVTEDDLRPIKESLAQPGGIDAVLGYYWSFVRGGTSSEVGKILFAPTSVPTLTLVGKADGAMDLSVFNQTSAAFSGPYQLAWIGNAGHFLHREKPQEVMQHILSFLDE